MLRVYRAASDFIVMFSQVDFLAFMRYIFGAENVNGGTRVVVREYDWIQRMLQMVASLPEQDKNRYVHCHDFLSIHFPLSNAKIVR